MGKFIKNSLIFLSGAALGAAMGVLYAPDEGTSTRDKISYRLYKYKKKLQLLLEEVLNNEILPDNLARNEGEKVINDAREKAEQLIKDVDLLINQIKEKK